jgi:uncharacterized membrane protein (UPF0127 family)
MAVSKMSVWTTYSLLGVLGVMFLMLGGFVYFQKQTEATLSSKAVVTQSAALAEIEGVIPDDNWENIYPNTKSIKIGEVEVLASVAKSWPERIKGLSGTPYLPDNVVKIFIFDSSAHHSIWMKDMNYSIDIIWVDEESKIVHIEKDASPESYPAMFVTKIPARYVIETAAGFVEKNSILVGEIVVLPSL